MSYGKGRSGENYVKNEKLRKIGFTAQRILLSKPADLIFSPFIGIAEVKKSDYTQGDIEREFEHLCERLILPNGKLTKAYIVFSFKNDNNEIETTMTRGLEISPFLFYKEGRFWASYPRNFNKGEFKQ